MNEITSLLAFNLLLVVKTTKYSQIPYWEATYITKLPCCTFAFSNPMKWFKDESFNDATLENHLAKVADKLRRDQYNEVF